MTYFPDLAASYENMEPAKEIKLFSKRMEREQEERKKMNNLFANQFKNKLENTVKEIVEDVTADSIDVFREYHNECMDEILKLLKEQKGKG